MRLDAHRHDDIDCRRVIAFAHQRWIARRIEEEHSVLTIDLAGDLQQVFRIEADLESFVRDFERGTLPKARWTHEAHLLMGLWYLSRHAPSQALAEMRARIRAYNDAVGTLNSDSGGYHETLTRLYLRVHWVSDVLGGEGVAAMSFSLVAIVALVVAFVRQNAAPEPQ